jgi:hypothetical protein
MTQRRGTCGLIDPAFENQNFCTEFNPHLETDLLSRDDSVPIASPSFTFEVKSGTTCGRLFWSTWRRSDPLNFVTYNVFWRFDSIFKIFFFFFHSSTKLDDLPGCFLLLLLSQLAPFLFIKSAPCPLNVSLNLAQDGHIGRRLSHWLERTKIYETTSCVAAKWISLKNLLFWKSKSLLPRRWWIFILV